MFARITLASIVVLCATGCFSLQANVPEEAVRYHLAKEEGVQLPAICSYEGKRFSEGAFACMDSRRMVCNPDGRWVQDGTCG